MSLILWFSGFFYKHWKNCIDKKWLGKFSENVGYVGPRISFGPQWGIPWNYKEHMILLTMWFFIKTLKLYIHTVTLYIVVTNEQVFKELLYVDTRSRFPHYQWCPLMGIKILHKSPLIQQKLCKKSMTLNNYLTQYDWKYPILIDKYKNYIQNGFFLWMK